MEDKQWLESLQVGDEVCYHSQWHGFQITKIMKITPTGQIKTVDRKTFKQGYCRMDGWSGYHLRPITDDVRDSILKRQLAGKISSVKWHDVPLDKLKRINGVLFETIDSNE